MASSPSKHAKEEGTASSNIRRWVKEHEIVWASEDKKAGTDRS
jgi:uncharacterized protein YhfF